MHPGMLDLAERTVLELAMSYDLVEFATAVKPLVLRSLLAEHEQVAYLDPDTYVVAPMEELCPALDASAGGIVLTPHYLRPVPPGSQFSEGHLLHVGAYNLGFCAVDRRAGEFLDWWWEHLRPSACTTRSRASSSTRSGSTSAASFSAARACGTTATTSASSTCTSARSAATMMAT